MVALATVNPPPQKPWGGPGSWQGRELRQDRAWLHLWSDAAVEELVTAALKSRASERPLLSMTADDFRLPTVGPWLLALRRELLWGRGFAVLRGLPVHTLDPATRTALFWGVGLHLGQPVPQNAQGHLLGHVIDLGYDASDPHVRIYQTRERQGFHTDSADVVGLWCMRPAERGGKSRLASIAAAYNALRAHSPEVAATLFEPFYTDHRGEPRRHGRPYFTAPVLSHHAGALSVLYQRRYIDSAQRFSDVPRLTARQRTALDAFDAILEDPDLHLEMDLEPGDMQWIHNHQLVHDRTAFVDPPDPQRRRHLLRLWVCPPEGRPLPPWFAERYGSIEIGQRGGVALRGIEPRLAPWPT